MVKRKINVCRSKKQFEIELLNKTGEDIDEYGFYPNPPIVLCAKSKRDARKQLKLPKGIEIKKIKKVRW